MKKYTFNELFNKLQEGEIVKIITTTWKPFKNTYAKKTKNTIVFMKRQKTNNFYYWYSCYDKLFSIIN